MEYRVGGDEIALALGVIPAGRVGVIELRVLAGHDDKPILRQQRELGGVQVGVLHEAHAAQIHRRHREITGVRVRQAQAQRIGRRLPGFFRQRGPVPRRESGRQIGRDAARRDRGYWHSEIGDHRLGHRHIDRRRRRRDEAVRFDHVGAVHRFGNPVAVVVDAIGDVPPPDAIAAFRPGQHLEQPVRDELTGQGAALLRRGVDLHHGARQREAVPVHHQARRGRIPARILCGGGQDGQRERRDQCQDHGENQRAFHLEEPPRMARKETPRGRGGEVPAELYETGTGRLRTLARRMDTDHPTITRRAGLGPPGRTARRAIRSPARPRPRRDAAARQTGRAPPPGSARRR